jgi:hypothetical protein
LNGIEADHKNDWDRRGRGFGGQSSGDARGQDYSDAMSNEFPGKWRQAIVMIIRPAGFDPYVPIFDKTMFV